MKTAILALAIAALPGLAAAMCNYDKEVTAQSCAPGSVMDNETGTCVPVVTG